MKTKANHNSKNNIASYQKRGIFLYSEFLTYIALFFREKLFKTKAIKIAKIALHFTLIKKSSQQLCLISNYNFKHNDGLLHISRFLKTKSLPSQHFFIIKRATSGNYIYVKFQTYWCTTFKNYLHINKNSFAFYLRILDVMTYWCTFHDFCCKIKQNKSAKIPVLHSTKKAFFLLRISDMLLHFCAELFAHLSCLFFILLLQKKIWTSAEEWRDKKNIYFLRKKGTNN